MADPDGAVLVVTADGPVTALPLPGLAPDGRAPVAAYLAAGADRQRLRPPTTAPATRGSVERPYAAGSGPWTTCAGGPARCSALSSGHLGLWDRALAEAGLTGAARVPRRRTPGHRALRRPGRGALAGGRPGAAQRVRRAACRTGLRDRRAHPTPPPAGVPAPRPAAAWHPPDRPASGLPRPGRPGVGRGGDRHPWPPSTTGRPSSTAPTRTPPLRRRSSASSAAGPPPPPPSSTWPVTDSPGRTPPSRSCTWRPRTANRPAPAGNSTLSALLETPAEGDAFRAAGPLVVCGGCETDLTTRDHDEALTLTSVLVHRLAADAIGSRWKVDDMRSEILMLVLHDALGRGLAPPDALRAAQRWMLTPPDRRPARPGAEGHLGRLAAHGGPPRPARHLGRLRPPGQPGPGPRPTAGRRGRMTSEELLGLLERHWTTVVTGPRRRRPPARSPTRCGNCARRRSPTTRWPSRVPSAG
ncbi:CHAT domain-containing protein [Streptomyces tricolor]|nr:CHAT domain-containing protein [Streptomyces tricolor]